MPDLIAYLSNPLFIVVLMAIVIALGMVFVIRSGAFSGKKKDVFVLERIKPHMSVLWSAKQYIKKNPGETTIALPDKRKLVVPEESRNDFEALYLPKKKRWTNLWPLENNVFVKFNATLSDATTPITDNETVQRMLNRDFFRRLAEVLGGNTYYIWLIMGAVVGMSLGYIVYPQFNHPAPITVVCERLQNGTLIEQLTGRRC